MMNEYKRLKEQLKADEKLKYCYDSQLITFPLLQPVSPHQLAKFLNEEENKGRYSESEIRKYSQYIFSIRNQILSAVEADPDGSGFVKDMFLYEIYQCCPDHPEGIIDSLDDLYAPSWEMLDDPKLSAGYNLALSEYENTVYTSSRWKKDRRFSAREGQEITEEVYNMMMNCLPPFRLPVAKANEIFIRYGIRIRAGFLMSEPYCNDQEGFLFMAFGTDGDSYYYLGMAKNEGC